MNKYVSIIFKHWQSSMIGVLILALTLMLWFKRVNATEWGSAMGVILTLAAFFMKDPNKTQSKE